MPILRRSKRKNVTSKRTKYAVDEFAIARYNPPYVHTVRHYYTN